MTTTTRDFPEAHDGIAELDDDGRAVLRFERSLDHPIEKVWSALTDPSELVAWFAHNVEIDLRIGGAVSYWLGDSRSEHPAINGAIEQLDAPHLLQATFDGGSTLRFELQATTSGTTLVFTDTRPVGEQARNSVLAGWHLRMDQLPDALNGAATDWVALDSNRSASGAVAAIEEIYWHYRSKPRGTND